jgi:hypothetical protein
MRHRRVVALSVDGNEATAGRTGPRFAEAFRRAGVAGLRRTVHAGESSGPEGVRDAIELLGADCIDYEQNLQSSRQNSQSSKQMDRSFFEPWQQTFPPQIFQVLLYKGLIY